MSEQLPWFKCEPAALLGALAGMKPTEGYVYTIVLLRIYESGGSCADSLDALAVRTRFNKRVVSEALDKLFRSERLYRGEGGIRNKKADAVLMDRGRRASAAANAANRRWEKDEQNQRNGHADAMRTQCDLDIERKKEKDSPPLGPPLTKKPRLPARTRLAEDFKLSPSMLAYAEKFGLRLRVSDLFDAFRDHHRSRGNTMADWEAAWRTWVRNEVKFSNRRGGSNGTYQGPSTAGGLAAQLRRKIEEDARDQATGQDALRLEP